MVSQAVAVFQQEEVLVGQVLRGEPVLFRERVVGRGSKQELVISYNFV